MRRGLGRASEASVILVKPGKKDLEPVLEGLVDTKIGSFEVSTEFGPWVRMHGVF